MRTLLLLALLFCFSQHSFSQKTKEIGIRFANINNFGLIYKTGKDENHLTRITAVNGSAATFNRTTEDNQEYSRNQFSLGLGIGDENHIAITENLDFMHGLGGGVGFQKFVQDDDGIITHERLAFHLNYLLGVVYEMPNNFNLGVEANPSIYYQNTKSKNGLDSQERNAYGFHLNTDYILLSLTYNFKK